MNTDMYFDPRAMSEADGGADGQPAAVRSGRLPPVSRRRHGRPRGTAVPDLAVDPGAALRPGPPAAPHGRSPFLRREHTADETWPCDWLSGCFLLVRREAIEAVGRFDEGYGKYFEDVDLCLRMARAGWQVMYHGATSCYHLEARASRNPFSADAWHHLRAYLRWLRRWGLHCGRSPLEMPGRLL